jgi:hypothetical protein
MIAQFSWKEDRTMTDRTVMDCMTTRRVLVRHGAVGLVAAAWIRSAAPTRAAETFEIVHSDVEWHKLLTPDQFAVLRKSATERPFTSALLHEERRGNFACAGCDLAELLGAIGEGGRHHPGHFVRDGEDGGALQPLRRPSRSRLQ